MKSDKIYKSGDKITIYESEDEKGNGQGNSVIFTYIAPSADDADLLYNIFQEYVIEYANKNNINLASISKHEKQMSEEEKALANQCMFGAFLKMKTNRESARPAFNACLSKCLIGDHAFPMAIMLPENEKYYNKLRLLILQICIQRFEAFTTPHSGE